MKTDDKYEYIGQNTKQDGSPCHPLLSTLFSSVSQAPYGRGHSQTNLRDCLSVFQPEVWAAHVVPEDAGGCVKRCHVLVSQLQ